MFTKKSLLLCLAIVNTTFFLQTSIAQSEVQSTANLVDKIVVIVNDDVITESELLTRIKRVKINNNINEIDDDIRRQILENMVQERVQLQRAAQYGITTSESEVNALVEQFARQRNVTVEQLRQELSRQGLPEVDFLNDLRSQSIIRKLVRSSVANEITVTDEEIETYTKANNIRPKNLSYDVSYLVLEYSESYSEEQKQSIFEQVVDIKAQLPEESFDALSNNVSNLGLSSSTENLGLKSIEELPKVFANQLLDMKPGQFSDVIQASAGLFVLKLNAVDGGATQTEKRSAQHILISANSELEIQRGIAVANRLKGQITAGEDFANVAKYYSDDSNSAANGGDLGWVRPGVMVPRFEKELFSMKEGEISDPIVTEFGVHLIKLNEVSITSDPQEYAREIAFNNIMTQKAEQYYPSFLSMLMGQAYIKYQ